MLSKTKQTGIEGELSVARHLVKNGWDVYLPFGDCTSIDIIAIKDKKILRIQVKTISSSCRGCVVAHATKVHNRKKVRYVDAAFDVLAMYVSDRDKIAFVPFEIIQDHSMTLRFETPKNGSKGRSFSEFELIP